jgi:hypothetical protein
MSIYHITQDIELKFWKLIIPIMDEEGPLMKTLHTTTQAARTKLIHIALLVIVWAAIGFISGMLIGRVIWILQVL